MSARVVDRVRMRGLGLLMVAVLSAGCGEVTPPPQPLEGWLADGCTAVRGGVCEARAGDALRLWLPARALDRIEVRVGGDAPPLQRTPEGAGEHVRWTVEGSGPVVITVRSATVARAATFTLALVDTATPAEPQRRAAWLAYQEGRAETRAGRDAEALVQLDRALELAGDDAHLIARIVATAVYLTAVRLDDPLDAERRLGELRPVDPLDGEGAALGAYAAGQVAWRLGDWRGADRAFGTAERLAERLQHRLRAISAQGRAMALVDAGQLAGARAIIARALAELPAQPPCWRADLLVSAGWIELREGHDLEAARARVGEALALYEGECGDTAGANNARLNLALIEEQAGRWDEARAALAAVVGPELPYASTWREALEGRALLARGELDPAERAFRRLRARAAAGAVESALWQAEVGLGRVAEARGQLERAAQAFQAAERSLDQQLRRAPIERGQLSYVEDRGESGDGLVRVRLRQGRVREAFQAARAARHRAIRAVGSAQAADRLERGDRQRLLRQLTRYHEARARLDEARAAAWETHAGDGQLEAHIAELRERMTRELDGALAQLPTEEEAALRDPAPGELMLLARPADGHHQAFAVSRTTARTATLAGPEASEWLRVFERELRAATRVTALASDDPRGLDLHTALLDGVPLAVGKRLAYALDLPPRSPSTPSRRALVVADARGDLGRARAEGRDVQARLNEAGWTVEGRMGSDTERAPTLAALRRTDLLHYAGHGWFAGAEGWHSGLALADTDLGVGDIVTSTAVPTWVVLSACEGAAASPTARSAGVGVAQAFLIAGSAQVVAAGPKVEDAVAQAFARDLHAAWKAGGDLSSAYRDAAQSGTAWRKFRLIER